MVKYIIKICFFAFLSIGMFAQGESNIWYFGRYAGLDFSSGLPVSINNSSMNTGEGCASICDFNGNLLFYTDGVSVWNRQNTKMPNGDSLKGHSSSTQSAVIVKKPGVNPVYLIFTVDRMGGSWGLTYSEVDMSLENGFGNVNSNKNIPVVSPVCEKIAAINHSNGRGYWIVTRLYPSNKYHSYLLDENGISNIPVVSSGIATVTGGLQTLGYLKASRTGTKIASAFTNLDLVELFDFDNSTGHLYNARKLSFPAGVKPYGVEFSPSEKYLYTSGFTTNILTQFDLSDSTEEAIIRSRAVLDSTSIEQGGALQIGSNDKIYMAFVGSDSLGVINSPENAGGASNYSKNGVFLTHGTSLYGLPTFLNFNQNNFSLDFEVQDSCVSVKLDFIPTIGFADSVYWNFGDPPSGSNNISNLLSPSHIYNDTGHYEVTVRAYYGDWSDTVSKVIYVGSFPEVDLGGDTIVGSCENPTVILNAEWPNGKYFWNTQSTNSEIEVKVSGAYWVTVNLNGCSMSDTVYVKTKSCSGKIEMPNIFTPNSDGVNDVFAPILMDEIKQAELQIYDRWGVLIFESNNLEQGWDGKSNGQECANRVYFWVISYTDSENNTTEQKGTLTLLR